MKANELRLGNYAEDNVLGIIEIDSTDKIYHALTGQELEIK